MAIPAAPVEFGGDKLHFLVYDGLGENLPALFRGYHIETVNAEDFGDLGVYPTSGSLENGAKTMTAGARVAVSATSVKAQGVTLKAYKDNTDTVWVGTSDVTADKTTSTGGTPLEPGEWMVFPCRDVSEVFIIGSGTDGVAWTASAD